MNYLSVPLKYRMSRGKKLSIYKDFNLSSEKEKVGGYFTGFRRVLTNIFGNRTVLAYVTTAAREGSSRRLFFSTVSPEQLQIFCAWQQKAPLNQTGSEWMQYIPLFLYSFRWPVEVSYYEQKTSGHFAAIWCAASAARHYFVRSVCLFQYRDH